MIQIGSKIKRKSSLSNKTGIVIKIFEKDNLVYDKLGNIEFSSIKGEFLIEFETLDNKKYRVCYSKSEILEIN